MSKFDMRKLIARIKELEEQVKELENKLKKEQE